MLLIFFYQEDVLIESHFMKTVMKFFRLVLLSLIVLSAVISAEARGNLPQTKINNKAEVDTATFAAGCFWATEAAFEQIEGVKEAVSGYSGGKLKNPSYDKVGMGNTGHAESVEVIYYPEIISYGQLLDIFFTAHDPTQKNGQGPDIGSQYRSVIFYRNEQEKQLALSGIKELNASGKLSKPVVTEVKPFERFYRAENYHQNYVKNHPDESYIQHVSVPKINKVKEHFPELLKDQEV
jgi:peptide-methionine (S)-S-oxide reductase